MTVAPAARDVPLHASDELALLDTALSAARMRAPLARALALKTQAPCHVVDAKYEPGSACTVLYELGATHAVGVVSFRDPGMAAYLFPDDPGLPGLRAAVDPHHVGRALFGPRAGRCRVTLLRYRPGGRATLRFDFVHRDSTTTLVGKVYGPGPKAAAVYAEGLKLWDALGEGPTPVIARVEAFLPEIPLVLWRPVPGIEMEPALRTAKGAALVQAAACALGVLHRAPLLSERLRPVTAELERLAARAARVERVAPSLGDTLLRWATALSEAGAGFDPPTLHLVHGDCKPSQFRLTGSGLSLLDFDHCGLADPASDVGTFLASLRQRGLSPLEPAFVDAYAEHGPIDRHRVRWFESVALLRKALRAFARAPRSPLPARLAHEGLACLTGARR